MALQRAIGDPSEMVPDSPPPAPWSSDRSLDLAGARAVVGDQFPDLRPVRCHLLGTGWDNEAYLVNDVFVFRFPKRKNVVPVLERELELLPVVGAALEIATPVPELIGKPCELFPYPFAAHRMIPGEGADTKPLTDGEADTMAPTLGRALGQLHAIPPSQLDSASLPVEEDPVESFLGWIREIADDFRACMPEDVVARWEPWLRGEIALPPLSEGPRVPTHNDLGAEHVLVDFASKRVTGIIDWADAAWGDRSLDFAGLHLWRGDAFLERILRHYPHTLEPGFHDRVDFLSTILALVLVGESQRAGDPAGLKRWRDFLLQEFEPRGFRGR